MLVQCWRVILHLSMLFIVVHRIRQCAELPTMTVPSSHILIGVVTQSSLNGDAVISMHVLSLRKS